VALDALEQGDEPVDVLGPAPAPLAMVRGRHRMHLLVKGLRGVTRARDLLARLAAETPRPRVAVDVDPVGML
jgi:primosomal protein N' (replication factor Y)